MTLLGVLHAGDDSEVGGAGVEVGTCESENSGRVVSSFSSNEL